MGRKGKEKQPHGRTGVVGWIGLITCALLFAGLLSWWGWRQFLRLSYFEITQVVVEGNLQLTTEEILSSLRLSPHGSLLEVDLMALRQRLLENPWIQEATVRRRLPFTLIVQVIERVPEAILKSERAYLLSADGVILAELQEDTGYQTPGSRLRVGDGPSLGSGVFSLGSRVWFLSLPIVKVSVERQYAIGEWVLSPKVIKGLTVWREFQARNATGGVPQEITLEEDGGYTVRLGPSMPVIRLKADDLEGQLERLVQVLTFTRADLTAYESVDLRFGERVIVRPKEEGEGGQGKRPDRRA